MTIENLVKPIAFFLSQFSLPFATESEIEKILKEDSSFFKKPTSLLNEKATLVNWIALFISFIDKKTVTDTFSFFTIDPAIFRFLPFHTQSRFPKIPHHFFYYYSELFQGFYISFGSQRAGDLKWCGALEPIRQRKLMSFLLRECYRRALFQDECIEDKNLNGASAFLHFTPSLLKNGSRQQWAKEEFSKALNETWIPVHFEEPSIEESEKICEYLNEQIEKKVIPSSFTLKLSYRSIEELPRVKNWVEVLHHHFGGRIQVVAFSDGKKSLVDPKGFSLLTLLSHLKKEQELASNFPTLLIEQKENRIEVLRKNRLHTFSLTDGRRLMQNALFYADADVFLLFGERVAGNKESQNSLFDSFQKPTTRLLLEASYNALSDEGLIALKKGGCTLLPAQFFMKLKTQEALLNRISVYK